MIYNSLTTPVDTLHRWYEWISENIRIKKQYKWISEYICIKKWCKYDTNEYSYQKIFEYIRIIVTPLCTLSSSSMICFYFDSKKTLIVCLDICFHIFVFIVTCNLPSSPSSPSTKRKAESRKKRTSWSPITHLYSAKRGFLKLAFFFSHFSPLCL